MKALILAAGIGSRLGEMTKDIPKCLVQINGKPILEYQLIALRKNGIRDIVIVTGYKAEKIKEYLDSINKFKDMNIKLINNPEYETSNSSYSFWLAQDEIKDCSYIHMNSDIIYHPEILKRIKESKYENIIGINKKIKLDETMEQVKLEGDKIVVMERMNIPGAVGRAVGIAKFSPKNIIWMLKWVGEKIKAGDKNLHCYGIIRKAVHYVDYYGLDAKNSILADVNTLDELREAEKNMKKYTQLFE